jgi:signal transduction histidine kinase
MATLGQLSAGLMHEINNPLNFANTAFHLLKKRMAKLPQEGQEQLIRPLGDIQDGIRRVADIITGLRGFSHPNDAAFGLVDIKGSIETSVRFVRIDPSEIFLQTVVEADCRVWGSSNQLIQIFVNLLQNAVDSLKEKGDQKKEITINAETRNEEVVIEFYDNGMGIPEEALSKIFDAFYTTKEVGSGVGLGLSICQQIAKHHGGRLEVESETGKFCRFNLILPKYETQVKTI